jgi:DNA sulfur modification protein DndE
MSFNRIRVSVDATNKLRALKARTGLTPNLLCRLAFTLSLNEPGIPDPQVYDENGQEFNRYTLTGEYDQLFIALLKERLVLDGLDLAMDLLPQFKAHLNRGVPLLLGRVKSLIDLHDLLPPAGLQPNTNRPSE